jgi:threonine dehydratase
MEQLFDSFDIARETLDAEKRIREYIRETPLEYSPYLSGMGNCRVFLKLENYQITGSFKYRGATNHILSLSQAEKDKGVMTASTGNHAAAFAHLLGRIGIKGTIYLPENTSGAKLETLRSYCAELKFYGTDCMRTEIHARETADANGRVYVPPYNHPKIIAGQATVALELERQLEIIDAVFVPIGGGGLMSGIAGYLKRVNTSIKAIGCQPENSPVMYESVKQGKIINMASMPTLSDGTAGGIEEGSLTFDMCKQHVDEYVLLSEDEIKETITLMIEKHNMLIEGAAALSVAAFTRLKDRFADRNVVLVISGNKISLDSLRTILCSSE